MFLRRSLRSFVVVATLVVAALPLLAGDCTPPPNEVCEDAIIFSNADLPYDVTAPLGCVNDEIDKPYFDAFYQFNVTQTGTYLIHMCGSSGDTYIRIYEFGCGWADGEELAVADDDCPGSPPNADPLLLVTLEAGERYWIEVGTWRDVPPWAPPPNSPYRLSVTFEGVPPGPAGTSDVDAGPDEQLQLARDGSNLVLSWGESCIVDDTDYAIYQGQIGSFGLHTPVVCSTGGATSFSTPSPLGHAYFLVTAQNGFVGGSYGKRSDGGQRSQGSPACLPRFFTECP